MSFFRELRRRKVFKVGAAYAVMAWVVLQVADQASPALRLPEWVPSLVLFFLLLGFPIAIFLAWAYELTPEGVRRTRNATNVEPSTGGIKFDLTLMALLVLAIGLIIHNSYFSDSTTENVSVDQRTGSVSIAVLPFLNLSDIPEQEHFADGLTEELLNSLDSMEGLRVVSRTSSFSFKGSPLSVTEIATQLGVEHILEGSVRRTGNNIRVTAQLIDATSDSHLWSENYDDIVSAEEVFKVQENIAKLVTDSLQVRLLPKYIPEAPDSLATLDLYYDGLFILNEIQNGRDTSDENFSRAVSKFEAALEAEPGWLPAIVRLGQVYHWWSVGGSRPEKIAKSRHYIEDALGRDPQNANAHAAMGYILWAEGDFEGSLSAYEKADQNGRQSGWGRAITLLNMGRLAAAVASYREAAQRYPVSSELKVQLVNSMYCAGQYSEITRNEGEMIASWPEIRQQIESIIALSHARLGNRERALAYVQALAQERQTEADFALTLAIVGEEDRARQAIDELADHGQGLASAATAARIIGEQDMALNLLERQYENRWSPGFTSFLFCEPEIRGLSGNPRYDAMLASLGLAPAE